MPLPILSYIKSGEDTIVAGFGEEEELVVDEMCRLMRVYGSLKCLRNRTTTKAKNNNNVDECSISIKIDSTKRKFYRWFPDLDERFVRNSETGCYEPKAGHVNEMAYRESMRMSDQNKLVMKRLNGRSKVHVK